MPRCFINDPGDPRLAPYRDLPQRRLLRESGLFIAEGRLLVERLLASRFRCESILVDEQHADDIARLVGEAPVSLLVVSRRLLEETIGFKFHRGVLACGRRRPAPTLDSALTGAAADATRPLTLVACADVHDPENVGGMLRNAAAFGVDAVVVSRRSADPFSRRVLRVSMGASLKLPIVEPDNLAATLRELRNNWGVETVATVLDDSARPLPDFRRGPRMALVFGSEGYGLPEEVVDLCDRRVTLPMRLGTDSLNVAVASGIFLYHVMG